MLLPQDDERMTQSESQSRSESLILVGFSLLLFGLFAAELFYDVSPARLAILFFLLAWGPLTVVHELGHALSARALGWKVEAIDLGFGPVVRRTKVWGMPTTIRIFPLVGLVQVRPLNLASARLKNALIYAAGPGVELLIAWVISAGLGAALLDAPQTYLAAAAQGVALAALVGALLNLIPFSPHPGLVTDGMGILQSPFLPRSHFESLLVQPKVQEAVELRRQRRFFDAVSLLESLARDYPAVLLIQIELAKGLIACGRREESLLSFRSFLVSQRSFSEDEINSLLEDLRDFRVEEDASTP